MLKTRHTIDGDEAAEQSCSCAAAASACMRPRVALLSNPKSTGNIAQLPRIRAFCADHPDLFHYEVEHADQIGEAMKVIARVRPKLLVINGGDGTVQAALTEIHNGGYFGEEQPPVAVLPSGKTNLIALDLGVRGDPVDALEQLIELAQGDLGPYTVARELIALRSDGSERPVIGMFLGGAGLAEAMLYCRHKIYPLGLPNGLSHVLAAIAYIVRLVLRLKASFLPPAATQTELELRNSHRLSGRFSLLAVTTLEKLLLSNHLGGERRGSLKVVAVEESPSSLMRALLAGMTGGYKGKKLAGIHFEEVDELTIHGESTSVIFDGETFSAKAGLPIHLRPTPPLSFVRLAA